MKYNYTCPKCRGHLLIDKHIILSVRKKDGHTGLVFVDPEPEHYKIVKHRSIEFSKGEILEIYCPICHHDLICIPEKNLAKVMIEEETGELLTLLFSVVFGENKTYLLKKDVEIKSSVIDFEMLSLVR